MCCGTVTVSTQEAKASLIKDGFMPGTRAYDEEERRRYLPDRESKSKELRLVERDDWNPKDKVRPVYSEEEVEAMLKADGFTPGTCDHRDEKYHRFTPLGVGSGQWIWSDEYQYSAAA